MKLLRWFLIAAGVVAALLLGFRIWSEVEWREISHKSSASEVDGRPPLVDVQTPQEKVSASAPQPFIPKHPVRARAVPVYGPDPIPGAIVCDTHDRVALMMDLYKLHFKERIENSVLGDRMNLLRGNPSPLPDLAANGCVLFKAGATLDRIRAFARAVEVEGIDAAGNRVKGVTDFFMIEDAAPAEPDDAPAK